MQNSYALPILRQILKDTTYHPIIRHEAAEALGALHDIDS